MSEDQAELRHLFDALQAIGVSDQIRESVERTYRAVTAPEALAAEGLPVGWSVQIVECSYVRGRLRVVGQLTGCDIVDRVLIGAPPWTCLTELPVVRPSNLEVHFDGEVLIAEGEVVHAAVLVRTLDQAVFRIGDLAARCRRSVSGLPD